MTQQQHHDEEPQASTEDVSLLDQKPLACSDNVNSKSRPVLCLFKPLYRNRSTARRSKNAIRTRPSLQHQHPDSDPHACPVIPTCLRATLPPRSLQVFITT